MPSDTKKGITVKIDAGLHAEVRQYLESRGMTMAEFVTLALDDELHPKINQKEGQNMGNMRTLAFQVPEDLFQRIKDYLQRNNMSQKEFVIGLIEDELEREQTERENAAVSDPETIPEETEEYGGEQDESELSDDSEDESSEYDEDEDESESYDENDDSDEDEASEEENEYEDENMGFSMGM